MYCEYILALQKRAIQISSNPNVRLPLAIMTSDDTHPGTIKMLKEHHNFGMDEGMRMHDVLEITHSNAHGTSDSNNHASSTIQYNTQYAIHNIQDKSH